MIKLPRDQVVAANSDCNYCRIRQDDRDYYFFVMSADWRARRTVAFHLSMDTINTWWDELSWNAKTTIQRQHGDRFSGVIRNPGDDTVAALIRKIDRYNEGFNPTLTTGTDNYPLLSDDLGDKDLDWYLIYKTRDGITVNDVTNPVSAFVLASESLLVERGSGGGVDYSAKTSEYAPGDTIAWITEQMFEEGAEKKVSFWDSKTHATLEYTFGQEHPNKPGIFLRAMSISGEPEINWKYTLYYYTGNSYPYSFAQKDVFPHNFNGNNIVSFTNLLQYRRTSLSEKDTESLNVMNSFSDIITLGTQPTRTIPFDQFDRSDSRISRIIKLPYPPCDLVESNDGVTHFPPEWEYNIGYKGMELPLSNQEFTSLLTEISLEDQFVIGLGTPPATFNEYLNYGMESKLYSSEFYNLSLMYDNVSHQVKLERLELYPTDPYSDNPVVPRIRPRFYVSNTMSSNFLFDIDYTNIMKRDPEYPYDNYLLSTRNNEMSIFSSGYVDYLRNGYNYDQEANRQAARQQIISAAIAVAGAVGAVYTGGASIAAAGAGIAALKLGAQGYAENAHFYQAAMVDGVPTRRVPSQGELRLLKGTLGTKEEIMTMQEGAIAD